MKKLFLFSLILAFMAGCQTPADEELEADMMLKSAKLEICHWDADNSVYVPISVPEVAYKKAHMDHGDKLCYSPEGEYVFKKWVHRSGQDEIIDTYDITIDKMEVGSDVLSGTGIRYLEDGRVAYIKLSGTVSGSTINFRIDQWMNNPEMTGTPMNWWILEGVTDQCGGISEITCIQSRESTHVWTIEEIVHV